MRAAITGRYTASLEARLFERHNHAMNRTPHILVVDDDPKIRSGLLKFLTDQGLRVTTAADGRDMRAKMANASIDLVILDVMMPGEDGLSICRKFGADNPIPVILLTAVAGETTASSGLRLERKITSASRSAHASSWPAFGSCCVVAHLPQRASLRRLPSAIRSRVGHWIPARGH